MQKVKATTFADPADVRRWIYCKKQGGTDRECYRVGDNGIGKWGHFTAQSKTPMVALPVEVWSRAGKVGGAPVHLLYRGRHVQAILGDTMPHLRNITNGAGIDLNPAAALALGIPVGGSAEGVQWEWA